MLNRQKRKRREASVSSSTMGDRWSIHLTLSIQERYDLVDLLAQYVSGPFAIVERAEALIFRLVLSSEERTNWSVREIRNPDGRGSLFDWPSAMVVVATISFSIEEVTLIADALRKLDAAGQLTLRSVSLYRKFVLREQEADGGVASFVPGASDDGHANE